MEKAVKKKSVKLIVKTSFFDKTDNLKLKKAGEELNVSPKRADKLISLGLAEQADTGAPEATAEK